jgi:hypothetical protein
MIENEKTFPLLCAECYPIVFPFFLRSFPCSADGRVLKLIEFLLFFWVGYSEESKDLISFIIRVKKENGKMISCNIK